MNAARHTFGLEPFAKHMDPSWVSKQQGNYSLAFTLNTYVHLLPGSRSLSAVGYGSVTTHAHNAPTRPQKKDEKDN